MMAAFSMIVAPLLFMALAFLGAIRAGFAAGEAGGQHKLGIGSLGLCVVLMLAQAALWALWGLNLGWVAQ